MATRFSSCALVSATLLSLIASSAVVRASASDPKTEVLVAAEASEADTSVDSDTAPSSQFASDAPSVAAMPPRLYQPPRRGAPARERVGSGITRGASALPTPLALAPDHVGFTVSASPSLFWHIDAVPSSKAELLFAITEEASATPLAEFAIARPSQSGIQRLRLADHGVELEPDVEYMWSIALVVNSDSRSEDVVSTGFIRRVARPAVLAANSRDGVAFAREGIWYDALEALSDAVDDRPSDPSARSLRGALLREAQLDAAIE